LQVFFKRLVSTLILWSVILGGLFAGGRSLSLITFWLVVCGLSFAAYREFGKMINAKSMKFGQISLAVLGVFFLSLELYIGRINGSFYRLFHNKPWIDWSLDGLPAFSLSVYHSETHSIGSACFWMVLYLFPRKFPGSYFYL
jgi:hypothetical protein